MIVSECGTKWPLDSPAYIVPNSPAYIVLNTVMYVISQNR